MTDHRNLISVSQPALIGNEISYVLDCLESNWISSNGKYIELFEQKFAEFQGVKHSISCCNGTTALHLALLALGIGSGDEVIVPTLTYVATANAVTYTGATPVLADCEVDTWNINPANLESLITPRTKAIIPVPLYGHPCDMDSILDLATRHKLLVVEDSAEAIGARFRGRLCGSMTDLATFSFYGNKIITTGEGGMVVTNDDQLAAKIRLFKGQGMDPNRRYWFPRIGYNYRMTNIQAAIGLAQMENVDLFLAKRKAIAEWYSEILSDVIGITLPVTKEYAEHSWWMYSILIEDDFGLSRDQVMSNLMDYGIETRPFFYPMHVMPIYNRSNNHSLATAEIVSKKGLNLPTFFSLTSCEVEKICNVLKKLRR